MSLSRSCAPGRGAGRCEEASAARGRRRGAPQPLSASPPCPSRSPPRPPPLRLPPPRSALAPTGSGSPPSPPSPRRNPSSPAAAPPPPPCSHPRCQSPAPAPPPSPPRSPPTAAGRGSAASRGARAPPGSPGSRSRSPSAAGTLCCPAPAGSSPGGSCTRPHPRGAGWSGATRRGPRTSEEAGAGRGLGREATLLSDLVAQQRVTTRCRGAHRRTVGRRLRASRSLERRFSSAGPAPMRITSGEGQPRFRSTAATLRRCAFSGSSALCSRRARAARSSSGDFAWVGRCGMWVMLWARMLPRKRRAAAGVGIFCRNCLKGNTPSAGGRW